MMLPNIQRRSITSVFGISSIVLLIIMSVVPTGCSAQTADSTVTERRANSSLADALAAYTSENSQANYLALESELHICAYTDSCRLGSIFKYDYEQELAECTGDCQLGNINASQFSSILKRRIISGDQAALDISVYLWNTYQDGGSVSDLEVDSIELLKIDPVQFLEVMYKHGLSLETVVDLSTNLRHAFVDDPVGPITELCTRRRAIRDMNGPIVYVNTFKLMDEALGRAISSYVASARKNYNLEIPLMCE